MGNVSQFLFMVCIILLKNQNVQCTDISKTDSSVFGASLSNRSIDTISFSEIKVKNKNMEEYEKKNSQKGSGGDSNLLTRLIPMLATPFLIQTTFLPMILLGIKLMLIKSIFLGKLAIIFWTINLLRNHIQDQQGHLYSHNIHLGHRT